MVEKLRQTVLLQLKYRQIEEKLILQPLDTPDLG